MSENLDPITEGVNTIYKDILDHGMTPDGRWTVSGHYLMWLFQALWNVKDSLLRQNIMATILSYVAVMYGNEIRVPSYLVASGIGTHKIKLVESFLPAEDGTDDWLIKIDVEDVTEEGETIED
jgi:hypothetical protein